MAKAKLVTGLFKTRVAAEAAVDAILRRGYTRDDISVLMSDATKTKEFALQTRTHAADGAGIGGAIGGTVGAVLAAIAAIGTSMARSGPLLRLARVGNHNHRPARPLNRPPCIARREYWWPLQYRQSWVGRMKSEDRSL